MRNLVQKILNGSTMNAYRFLYRKIIFHRRVPLLGLPEPCIFVLSTGRVGTETLAALFGLTSDVLAYHEPIPELFRLSKLAYENNMNQIVETILKSAFLTSREDLLGCSFDINRGYVETSPQATFLASVIDQAVPNPYFIHLVRDPRDVVRSGMRRKWYAGHPADKTRIVPNPGSEASRQWEKYSVFQKNIWLWTETNRWILDFSSKIEPCRTLLLHSEKVFDADEDTLHHLFSFVGLPVPPRWRFRRVLRRQLNAQRMGEFPDSSAWTPEMNDDLVLIAGETMQTLGYNLVRDS